VRGMQHRPWPWPPASAYACRERLLDRPHAGDRERAGAPLQEPVRKALAKRRRAAPAGRARDGVRRPGWQGVRGELTGVSLGRHPAGLTGVTAGRSRSGSRPRTCRRCGGSWPRARRRSTRCGATRRWPVAAARRAATRPRRAAATARPRAACREVLGFARPGQRLRHAACVRGHAARRPQRDPARHVGKFWGLG
jgi:hypothetical protein